MTHKCELIELQSQTTLATRTRTPVQELPVVLGQIYGTIMQYLCEHGEVPGGAPYVAYFNLDMQDLDIEVGIPVSRPLPQKGDVLPGEIPAGKYAACLHVGPYSEVEPAYNALMTWVKDHKYDVTGVAYELYLNDPGEVPPGELQTQILFPLK